MHSELQGEKEREDFGKGLCRLRMIRRRGLLTVRAGGPGGCVATRR